MQHPIGNIDIGQDNLPQFPGDIEEKPKRFQELSLTFTLYEKVMGDDAYNSATDQSRDEMKGIEDP
jgi:hypothetical protein